MIESCQVSTRERECIFLRDPTDLHRIQEYFPGKVNMRDEIYNAKKKIEGRETPISPTLTLEIQTPSPFPAVSACC